MSDNQINCPYCLAPIQPHETLAVCSTCNLAHHDDCWHDNGECTRYGCNGTPRRMTGHQYMALAQEEDESPIDLMGQGLSTERCPYCGGLIKALAIKCKHCKRILNASGQDQQRHPQHTQPGWQTSPTYHSPLPQQPTQKFNWGAFFFGPLWYLFSGLWLKAIVLFVINLILYGTANLLGPILVGLWMGFMFPRDNQRYLNERRQFLW